ncbi:MAG: hypothetical protein FJ303_27825, partial [Planctomycetes bacterium]|nr:hypothetical protein [Planctomycetota bacterium]
MRSHTIVRALIIALTLVAGPMAAARAERVQVYNLDSLVHLSTEVAEAEITRVFKADTIDLVEAKVSLIHKGGFKKGQVIAVAHLDYYRKPARDRFNWKPMEVGDRVVLFLVRVKANEFFRIPEDAVIYGPVTGGVRLIHTDQVHAFTQWGSPGPLVAWPRTIDGKVKPLGVNEFRKQIETSLRDTQELARLVEAKSDKLDVQKLVKVLADRSKVMVGRDHFTERICVRFAERYDFELLSQALAVAKDYNDVSVLQCGFGTAKGRDFLLARVSNEQEPMAARLRHARAIGEAGAAYRSVHTAIARNGHRTVEVADEGNSGYQTRIAKVLRAGAKHEELARTLLRNLDYFGQGISQNKREPLVVDLHGANAVLKELYDTNPSQEMQYAIEKATAWMPDDYDKLKSPCGDLISILRRADPARYTKPDKRSLIFEYEYTARLIERGAEVKPAVVLEHQDTKKQHVFETSLTVRGGQAGGGSNVVELPAHLPKGRYHVFLQLSD